MDYDGYDSAMADLVAAVATTVDSADAFDEDDTVAENVVALSESWSGDMVAVWASDFAVDSVLVATVGVGDARNVEAFDRICTFLIGVDVVDVDADVVDDADAVDDAGWQELLLNCWEGSDHIALIAAAEQRWSRMMSSSSPAARLMVIALEAHSTEAVPVVAIFAAAVAKGISFLTRRLIIKKMVH